MDYFSQTFPNHLFLMDNLFLPNYLFMNGLIFETLSGLHLISSQFNAQLLRIENIHHLHAFRFNVAVLFFIQSGESIHEPPCSKFTL